MRNVLCFGDSNTWGFNPVTKGRYPEGVRWTSILQNIFRNKQVKIIEEGLCGRTTIYEDETRPNRKGIDSIPDIFERNSEKNESCDTLILMHGTNDGKKKNPSSPEEVADGINQCLDKISEYVSSNNILLISPIHLGEYVWKEEYDPEFDAKSVLVSRRLKQEYQKIARKRGIQFLAASDYVSPSEEDQEHLNAEGHHLLAQMIYDKFLARRPFHSSESVSFF